MPEKPPPSGHARIDAAHIHSVDVCDDGQRLRLRVLDQAGLPASVTLPVDCLNTLLTALPPDALDLVAGQDGPVHRLDGWTLRSGEHDLLLTLRLPNGANITFAVKSRQIEAISSLAGLDRSEGSCRHN